MKTILFFVAAGYLALVVEGYLGFAEAQPIKPTITLVPVSETIR